ncbi:cell division control protein 14, SIN component-domain-containing protein [Dipodascopsis uninucleata]
MEYLLSSAFDLLLSYDPAAVRRGLRHIEGLLAHLCRPYDGSPKKSKSSSSISIDTRVADDPAYREFLRLQDNFEWNDFNVGLIRRQNKLDLSSDLIVMLIIVALRLASCLEKLLGQKSSDLVNSLILSNLDLLQGVLLIHPPSRRIFVREVHMTILLDLLDPQSPATIQGATVNCLVCALAEEWANVRTFESLDGLACICTLFKRKETEKEVKLKILEFLFFYLIPEPQGTAQAYESVKLKVIPEGGPSEMFAKPQILSRTTQEKQKMLGKYLSNVDSLVNELRKSQPFGNLVM